MFYRLGDDEGIATVLEAMAWLDARAGELDRAARLAGAAEAQRQRLGTHLYGLDRMEHEAMLAHLEAHVAPARLFEAWRAGQAMPLSDGLALALLDAQVAS
jgi:serine/threonine-protein kinase PknK